MSSTNFSTNLIKLIEIKDVEYEYLKTNPDDFEIKDNSFIDGYKVLSHRKVITYNHVLYGGTKSPVKKSKKIKLPGWKDGMHTCHLIAKCLGGSNEFKNLFVGTEDMNCFSMYPIEEYTKNYIKKTQDSVFYIVKLFYNEEQSMPKKISITIIPLIKDTKEINIEKDGIMIMYRNS